MTLQSSTQHQESLLPGPVLIVEDEPITQVRLRAILTSLGYADDALLFAGSIAEANALLGHEPCALALVDVGLPDGNGIDLIRTMNQRDAALPVLVISAWSDEHTIVSALQAGATGYLLKERDDIELSSSVRSALRGGAPVDPFVARYILQLIAQGGPKPPAQDATNAANAASAPRTPLSSREMEILDLVGKGLTNREISEHLSLSRLTVECHTKNIYKKLAVNSRTQAVFEARTRGFLP